MGAKGPPQFNCTHTEPASRPGRCSMGVMTELLKNSNSNYQCKPDRDAGGNLFGSMHLSAARLPSVTVNKGCFENYRNHPQLSNHGQSYSQNSIFLWLTAGVFDTDCASAKDKNTHDN
jgi:hypothetical protein